MGLWDRLLSVLDWRGGSLRPKGTPGAGVLVASGTDVVSDTRSSPGGLLPVTQQVPLAPKASSCPGHPRDLPLGATLLLNLSSGGCSLVHISSPAHETSRGTLGPGPVFLLELGRLPGSGGGPPVVPTPLITAPLAPCSHGIWLSLPLALTSTPKCAPWEPPQSPIFHLHSDISLSRLPGLVHLP